MNIGGSSKYHDSLSDPYSTRIVDDMLNNLTEWRNIDDIVRLTFKALSDVLRTQNSAIRELEKQMAGKVSRNEFSSVVSNKPDTSQVHAIVNDMRASLEEMISMKDYQSGIEDCVSKTELQYFLGEKASMDEVKSLISTKAAVRDVEAEIYAFNSRIDEIQKEINRKLANLPTHADIQHLAEQLNEKANFAEIDEVLQNKANKQSVANALHRKANRADMDQVLSTKADLEIVERMSMVLERKLDANIFEALKDDIRKELIEGGAFEDLLNDRSSKHEIEKIKVSIEKHRLEQDKQLAEQAVEITTIVEAIKSEIENVKFTFTSHLNRKTESGEFEKLLKFVERKIDEESVYELIDLQKQDFKQMNHEVRSSIISNIETLKGLIEETSRNLEKNTNHNTKQIKAIKEEIQEIITVQKKVTDHCESIAISTREELETRISNLQSRLESIIISMQENKLDRLELKSILDKNNEGVYDNLYSSQKNLSRTLVDLNDEIKKRLGNIESELFKALDEKVSLGDMSAMLETKLDINKANRMFSELTSDYKYDQVVKEIEILREDFDNKANRTELENHIQQTRNALAEVAKDMCQKANLKDICIILDTKANIKDTNTALIEIHKELDLKLSRSDLDSHNTYIQSLSTSLNEARWLWKSGDIRAGVIPWERQIMNTDIENFIWEQDKTTVIISDGGIYEIKLGIFSRKKPTLILTLNGETIVTLTDSTT
jgi:hypothetical protein